MKTCVKCEPLFFKKDRNYTYASVRQTSDRRTAGGKLKMQAFNANVQNRILGLVKAILEQNSIAAEIDSASRLVDVGLTSILCSL